jgi:hypothetical protein
MVVAQTTAGGGLTASRYVTVLRLPAYEARDHNAISIRL